MMSMLPKAMAATGQGIPDLCSRHGKAPVSRRKFTVANPVGAGYLALLLGVVVFFIYRALTRKTASVVQWPFCQECLARRRNMVLLGTGGMAASVGLIAGGVALERGWMTGAGVVVLIAAAVVLLEKASWANIARVTYLERSEFIQVEAAPEFAGVVASSPQIAAVVPPQAQLTPIQWFRPLKPIWVIGLLLGLLMLGSGLVGTLGGPRCGGETMAEGDVCVTERRSRETERSYEDTKLKSYLLLVGGVVLAVAGGAGVTVNKTGNNRRRREWLAKNPGA